MWWARKAKIKKKIIVLSWILIPPIDKSLSINVKMLFSTTINYPAQKNHYLMAIFKLIKIVLYKFEKCFHIHFLSQLYCNVSENE